jgi:hypothetical protein
VTRGPQERQPEDDEEKAAEVWREFERFGEPHDHGLRSRHISAAACRRFDVRWDDRQEAWVILVRSFDGVPTGWQVKRSLSDGVCWPDGDEDGPELDVSNMLHCRVGTRLSQACFGLEHYARVDRLVLVESPLDVVYLSELRIPAVASFGAHVNDDHLFHLRHRTSHLILGLDNDEAGREATEQILLRSNLFDLGFERLQVLDYTFTDAKDPGEMRKGDLEVALSLAQDARRPHRGGR